MKDDIISFEEFALVIETTFIFQDFADEVSKLFHYLDKGSKGSIMKSVTSIKI